MNQTRQVPLLQVPINATREVDALADAGADVFYFGLTLAGIREERVGWAMENGRDKKEASVGSTGEMRELVAAVHARGRRTVLAMNRLYPPAVLPAIEEATATAIESGVDGVIVSDLALFRFVQQRWPELPITASTIMGIHNSAGIALAGRLGFRQVVLPRPMRLEEIKGLTQGEGPGIEIFIARERCRFINAYCRLEHLVPNADGSGFERKASPICTQNLLDDAGGNWQGEEHEASSESCGLCAIAALRHLPRIHAFKIVGRGNPLELRLRFVREARRLLDSSIADRVEAEKDVRREQAVECSPAKCYYPAIEHRGKPTPVAPQPAEPTVVPQTNLPIHALLFAGANTVDVPDGMAGIYLGHETCVHLLPSLSLLRKLASSAIDRGMEVRLVLPPLFADRELRAGLKLAAALATLAPGRSEVTANDVGTLIALREELGDSVGRTLGRLLVFQRHDPRLLRWKESAETVALVNAMPAPHIGAIGEMALARRAEVSPSREWQKWEAKGIDRLTLHAGPGLLSMGRACVTLAGIAAETSGVRSFQVPTHCDRPCLTRHRKVSVPGSGESYLVHCNAMLAPLAFPNALPAEVDRIVIHLNR